MEEIMLLRTSDGKTFELSQREEAEVWEEMIAGKIESEKMVKTFEKALRIQAELAELYKKEIASLQADIQEAMKKERPKGVKRRESKIKALERKIASLESGKSYDLGEVTYFRKKIDLETTIFHTLASLFRLIRLAGETTQNGDLRCLEAIKKGLEMRKVLFLPKDFDGSVIELDLE